ncbi:MAG: hypothetical protein KC417_16860, partial [Myxococcales bacterium]|nr:hypothetical protein [Myxococcales bacterium]
FIVEDPAQRERDMRFALRYVQEPPKGINELIVSPMSFLAAVDANGKVIARDLKKADEDQMKGEDFAAKFPVVRRALEDGIATEGLVTFDATDDKAKPPASYSMLFVAPARVAGKVVGALVAGIPLWRWSQRLSTQGQLELTKEPSAIYWVFAWKGDQLFPPKQGLEFDALLPDAAARKAGLAASPRGFMGKAQQYDRWYVYGVLPVPSIASDAGFIVVRGEPLE